MPTHSNDDANPLGIVNEIQSDWRLRSLMLKELSRRLVIDRPRIRPTVSVPRLLVQYWDTRIVPSDVRLCMSTWSRLDASGFERVSFHRDSAREFIRARHGERSVSAFDAAPHPAIRSDYFRLCFLAAEGGCYVDADDRLIAADVEPLLATPGLVLQALCYSIDDDRMLEPSEAIAGPDDLNVIHYVNNDPIFARPAHPVIVSALHAATAALTQRPSNMQADVQAIAGPGALGLALALAGNWGISTVDDVAILTDWDRYAVPEWDLAYRRDGLDWRTWDGRAL